VQTTATNPDSSNAPSKPLYGPPPPPPTTNSLENLALSAEEAELAASLEGMMKQFFTFSGTDFRDDKAMQDAERAMDDMFQQIIKEEANVGKDNDPSNSKTSKKKPATNNNDNNNNNDQSENKASKVNKKENNMDETINNLLNNIQQPTNIPANIDTNLSTLNDDTLSTLLADLANLTSSNDAPPIIDTVMKQLLDKELMYTPMKDVCTRFPEWLARNNPNSGGRLSQAEYERYGKQYTYFQKIVRVYETEPNNFERLMELMQDIQE
jgi:peroxin-19